MERNTQQFGNQILGRFSKMEKHINNKSSYYNKMSKILITISLLIFSMTFVNSTVTYNIDEGFGGVIFDSSNTGRSGVSNIPKETFWSPVSKFGSYSVYPKAGKQISIDIGDYPQLTPQIGNFTIQFTYFPTTQLAITEILLSKIGSYDFSITGQPIGSLIAPGTFTLTLGGVPIIIPINNISFGQMNTLFVTYNGQEYFVYSNNISQTPLGITSLLHPDLTPLAPLSLFSNSFTGLIDEFKILNSFSDQLQINSLNTPGTITNNNISTPIINQLIFNVTSPLNNQAFIEIAVFELRLNEIGTCNLYVDNNFKKTYSNVLTFNDKISFADDYGNHTQFFNCFNSNFNEITPVELFSVIKNPNTQITFNFVGLDFPVSDMTLELVTPCLKKGLTFAGAVEGFRPLYNTGGAQFKDIQNGGATMVLPTGTYEFCLINGMVTYDTYNHTATWNPNNIIKQLKLGKFDLPNNLSTTYTISLEKFDMYDKNDPKAWNTSWVAIISSLLAFFLGLAILGGGIMTKSGHAVVIGGLLLLFSLGYQITNLVFGVLM